MKAVYDPETEMLRIGGGKSVYVTREEFEELREAAKERVGEEKVEISKKDLEFLLDQTIAYTGTYEGSTIEKNGAEVLRRNAELLGLEPMEYTPMDFLTEYKHKAVMKAQSRRKPDGTWYTYYSCDHCHKGEGDEVHNLGE